MSAWSGRDTDRRQGYIAFYADGTSSGGKLALTDPTGRVYNLEVEIIPARLPSRPERDRLSLFGEMA